MADVLVLGATGFTGRLITRYLHVHRERESFSLGIAGRSTEKLNELAEDLSLGDSVKIFQVDVTKEEELERVITQTKVLINTVGPFFKWSIPVVKCCARRGVHYVDVTGETPFVQTIIKDYDYLATKSRAIIIPSCGFDSLPADLSAFLSAKTLLNARATSQASPEELTNVDIDYSTTSYAFKGGVSGGTLSTALTLMEDSSALKAAKDAKKAFALSPIEGDTQPPTQIVYSVPAVGKSSKVWGYLIPLSAHNCAIVQRTWGVLHLDATKLESSKSTDKSHISYGPHFKYAEFTRAAGPISAFFFGLGLAISMAAFALLPPVRWIVKALGPKPGEGPSDETMENGFLKMRNITVTTPDPKTNKRTVVETKISGRGDPGYALTAVMISESALSILLNKSALPPTAQEGGVLTPVTGLGEVIVERLKESGRWEFESRIIADAQA